MKEEQIDELVKSKLEEKAFRYRPAYWHHAEAMIIAHRGGSAAFWTLGKIIGISAAAITTLAAGGYLYFAKPDKQMLNQTTTITSATAANPNQNITEINKTNTHSNSQAVVNDSKADANNVQGNVDHAVTMPEAKAQQTSKRAELNKENEAYSALTSSIKEKNSTSTPAKHKSIRNEQLISEPREPEMASNTGTSIGNPEEVERFNFTPVSNKSNIELMMNRSFTFTNLAAASINIPEFTPADLGKITRPAPKPQKAKANLNIAIEAGANSFNSMFASNSLGYMGGIKLYIDLGSRISLTTYGQYNRVNQSLPNREYTYAYYDFGPKLDRTTIKTKSFDYATVGTGVLYHVSTRQSIGAGLQLATLINSTEEVSKYSDESKKTTTTTESGYSSVFNEQDLQVSITYQYRLSQHIALSGSLIQGLSDVTNNISFQSNHTHTNTGFQITVQYLVR